jgi:catalase
VIDLLERNSGPHPGYRRAQARGACFQGIFTPSGEASGLTTAAHLQRAAVPATVRFSHSDGNPGMPDTERVVRGLTTRFHLRGDDHTDLLAVSIPVFLAANPTTSSRP